MDFKEISAECPWRRKTGLCSAISNAGAFGECSQKGCGIWHWLYYIFYKAEEKEDATGL